MVFLLLRCTGALNCALRSNFSNERFLSMFSSEESIAIDAIDEMVLTGK